jgi:hypothetical protein
MKKKIDFSEPRNTLTVDVPKSGFGNGLVMGALVGAAGFFLYGTKKGQQLKKNLQSRAKKIWKELDEVKTELTNPLEPPLAPTIPSKKKRKVTPKK